MNEYVVPMIHVPDVRATVEWYQSIGFNVVETYDDGTPDGLSFAILSFGNSQVMFNQGGEKSTKRRREVDLYTYVNDVDELHSQLKDRVDVIEGPHHRAVEVALLERERVLKRRPRAFRGYHAATGQDARRPAGRVVEVVPALDDVAVHVDDDHGLRRERRQHRVAVPRARGIVDRDAGRIDRRRAMRGRNGAYQKDQDAERS